MDILFGSSALEKACNDKRKGIRKYGKIRFQKIRLRLDQLRAADRLTEVPPSARCHPLKADRAGQFAVLLDGGWRLVFVPANDPPPVTNDGGYDFKQVTVVEVIEVLDYHD